MRGLPRPRFWRGAEGAIKWIDSDFFGRPRFLGASDKEGEESVAFGASGKEDEESVALGACGNCEETGGDCEEEGVVGCSDVASEKVTEAEERGESTCFLGRPRFLGAGDCVAAWASEAASFASVVGAGRAEAEWEGG